MQVFFVTDFINKFMPCINDASLARKFFKGALVLLRGTTNSALYNFLHTLKGAHKFLQKNNFYFTPNASAKQIADDKLLQYKVLGKIMPKTISACQGAQKLPYPCVLKPRFGSLGRNVVLVNSFIDAKNYIVANSARYAQNASTDAHRTGTSAHNIDGTRTQNANFDDWILQTYIKSTFNACPFDARFFVCGKKVIYKVARISMPSKSTSNAIASNISQGGKVCDLKQIIEQKFCTAQNFCTQKSSNAKNFATRKSCNANATRRANALIAKMARTAIKALKKAGLDYGAVDFLLNDNFFEQKNFTKRTKFTRCKKFTQRAFYLCEINASPGFEGLDAFTNESCAEQIIKGIALKLIK